ncbi:MAG: DUF1080 domain-containing protein [Planctomycetaceae bacterium]|nr:DUF1080 domain-containing protein [Planctomycetaceae bacterium]MCB9953832.1 DUF1080 domain-containing protein [Planctomycetaceae bacterium]
MRLTQFVALLFVSSGLFVECHAQDIGLPSIDPQGDGVVDLLKNRLDDWKAEDGRPIDNWRVSNGVLTNWKAGSHLVTQEKYRDFDLSLQFSLPRGGNSGVYLRGRYEVQLYDGTDVPPNKCTGSIWGQIAVESQMYKGNGAWNELQVRMQGNKVTVLINRKPVIRSQELKGPTRGAIDQNESGPGPILLQSLRGARFRNIMIKEL